jgi:predicted AAA+ superfamily ATPase
LLKYKYKSVNLSNSLIFKTKMMKKRLLFYELIKDLSHKNALVITGMRQVGKSTLLKQVYDYITDRPKLWFDFENPLDYQLFESIDYKDIYLRLQKMAGGSATDFAVFIDEIQNFPIITKIIKYLIDHYRVKFIVTGSSNYYLKNLFPESLSGRKFLFELPPLGFKEFLYFQNTLTLEQANKADLNEALEPKNLLDYEHFNEAYEDYLQFGGFPEVVVTEDRERKTRILKNIFASFFEKDLKLLSDYSDIRELRDLILLLTQRVGSALDISNLASELSAERAKIYNYLEFLQGTFFIRLLPKFSKSIDRSVAGGRKVYFTDSGLLNAIGKITDGQLLENTVINQLCQYARPYGGVSFYNRRNTAEIDAVLNKEIAFEIKLTGTEQDIRYVRKLAGKLNLKQAFVISKNFKDIPGVIFPMSL